MPQVSKRGSRSRHWPVPTRPRPNLPRPTTPVLSLEEVLRFDVTTAWVLSKWPRVSANLAELDMQGYRVPLVTGTGDADVAGSLTYYFNAKQRSGADHFLRHYGRHAAAGGLSRIDVQLQADPDRGAEPVRVPGEIVDLGQRDQRARGSSGLGRTKRRAELAIRSGAIDRPAEVDGLAQRAGVGLPCFARGPVRTGGL